MSDIPDDEVVRKIVNLTRIEASFDEIETSLKGLDTTELRYIWDAFPQYRMDIITSSHCYAIDPRRAKKILSDYIQPNRYAKLTEDEKSIAGSLAIELYKEDDYRDLEYKDILYLYTFARGIPYWNTIHLSANGRALRQYLDSLMATLDLCEVRNIPVTLDYVHNYVSQTKFQFLGAWQDWILNKVPIETAHILEMQGFAPENLASHSVATFATLKPTTRSEVELIFSLYRFYPNQLHTQDEFLRTAKSFLKDGVTQEAISWVESGIYRRSVVKQLKKLGVSPYEISFEDSEWLSAENSLKFTKSYVLEHRLGRRGPR